MDIFGCPVKININKEETFKTSFGGIISFMFFALIIFTGIESFIVLLSKKKINLM